MTDSRYSIGDLDGLLGIVVAAVVADIQRANDASASGKKKAGPVDAGHRLGERDERYAKNNDAQRLAV